MKIETFEQKIREDILKNFPELDEVTSTWFEVTTESRYKFKQIRIIAKGAYCHMLTEKFGTEILNFDKWSWKGYSWKEVFLCALKGLKELHKGGE